MPLVWLIPSRNLNIALNQKAFIFLIYHLFKTKVVERLVFA